MGIRCQSQWPPCPILVVIGGRDRGSRSTLCTPWALDSERVKSLPLAVLRHAAAHCQNRRGPWVPSWGHGHGGGSKGTKTKWVPNVMVREGRGVRVWETWGPRRPPVGGPDSKVKGRSGNWRLVCGSYGAVGCSLVASFFLVRGEGCRCRCRCRCRCSGGGGGRRRSSTIGAGGAS